MWLIASKLIKLSSLEMRNIIRSGSQTETIKFHLYIFARTLYNLGFHFRTGFREIRTFPQPGLQGAVRHIIRVYTRP